jgi:hypothetical protein
MTRISFAPLDLPAREHGTNQVSGPLEHFQEKACPRLDRGWNPVFRPKMRQRKTAGAASVSSQCETALAGRLLSGPVGAGTGTVCAALLLALAVTIAATAGPVRAEDRSAAATVGDRAQAGTSTVRPPDPPKRVEAGAAGQGAAISTRAEGDDATTAPQYAGNAQDEPPAQWSAAVSGETIDIATIMYAGVFLLIAGGLVVAAIVLRKMIKGTTKRQSSRRQFETDLAAVIAAARRAAPPLPRSHAPNDYAGAQTRAGQQPAAGTAANRRDDEPAGARGEER